MKVSVQSLKSGLNFFEFDAQTDELGLDESNCQVQRVHVTSKVDKGEHSIVVTADATATIEMVCESCLERFTGEFSDKYTILYTPEKEALQDDEMVRFLSKGTNHIDLTEGLRESILLALPMRFKCSESCKGLCDQCGANLNKETCECRVAHTDARWDGLRKLFEDELND